MWRWTFGVFLLLAAPAGAANFQCNLGHKVFSVENGNTVCAPLAPHQCVHSCEWNTSCSNTAHSHAFHGRRTFVAGMILTTDNFLLLYQKLENRCVWVPPTNTIENGASVRFDPPLNMNEFFLKEHNGTDPRAFFSLPDVPAQDQFRDEVSASSTTGELRGLAGGLKPTAAPVRQVAPNAPLAPPRPQAPQQVRADLPLRSQKNGPNSVLGAQGFRQIKRAIQTNQCPPLSMTSVLQCFPRFYDISSVGQCCEVAAAAPRSSAPAPSSFLSPPSSPPRLPGQCQSLCAPNFKLSFSHFACVDHISTIVDCYRDLLLR
ncbi:hypothetical protein M3Y99_00424400 [Aphelenchoides fujianensis]|nr:hypothetical protein M3Y99_00424400 [Aphelenchoides fujianensis]